MSIRVSVYAILAVLVLGVMLPWFVAWYVGEELDPSEFYRRHKTLITAFCSVTVLSSLALGVGVTLFCWTYELEPYYGSFYGPVLAGIGAVVTSVLGLITAVVGLKRVRRAGRH